MDAYTTPFNRELYAQRITAGLSQTAAAKQAGMSPSRWRQVEVGYETRGSGDTRVTIIVNPSPEFVSKAAQALNWDRVAALTLAGYNPDDVPEYPTDTNIPTIVEQMRRLTPSQQSTVEMVIRTMTDPYASPLAEAS